VTSRFVKFGFSAFAVAALAACAATPEAVAPPPPLSPPEPIPAVSSLTGTYLAAKFAASQGELDGAANYYGNLLEYDPGNSDLVARTFLFAASAGDMDAAIPLARRVVLVDPRNRPAHLLLAAEALKLENYALAEEEIGQAGGGAFFSLTNTLIQAWALAGAGSTNDALVVLNRLADQNGVQALHDFHRALILEYSGRMDEAGDSYRDALSAAGIGARGADALGRYLRRTGRTEQAEALYERLAEGAPDTPIAKAGLSEIEAGRIPEPLVSSPAEGAAEGLFTLASSLTGENNSDIAVLYLNIALYLRPDLELARAFLGDRYERIEKYRKAIEVYSEISPDSPYYAMMEIQTAVNLGRVGRADEAIARMRALTRRDSENVDACTALGDLLRGAGEYGDAIPAYNRSIGLLDEGDERLVELYFARGICYQNVENWDDAESDFQSSLAIDPEHADVLNFLGYSWVDQGVNLSEAVAVLEKARSLRPLDGYIADSVGWAYYKLGRYGEAAEVLEQAVQLAPGASEINDHLGDAYWMIGRKLDARFEWTHALNLDPAPEVRPIIERKLRIGLEAAAAAES
jgi:tetratricopeptide (TPR) repeat protein